MGTTYKNFSKLVAGASTRANLISYFNSNMDAIDALLSLMTVTGGGMTLEATQPASTPILCIRPRDSPIYGDTIFSDTHIATYCPSILFGDGTGWKFCIGKRSDDGATKFLTITDAGDAIFLSDVSALTFTDRTEAFPGSALSDIEKIKTTTKGDLDHATLPEFAISPYQDAKGEWWPGRSLGAMISVLVKATQERNAQFAAAVADRDAKIGKLESRIAALEKAIAAPAKKA